MVSNSTAEIDTKVAEEIKRLNEEYENTPDGNDWEITLETKYIHRLSQLKLKKERLNDELILRHYGEEPLKIDIRIHDHLPNIRGILLQGKIEFTSEAVESPNLKWISLQGDDLVECSGQTIAEVIKKSLDSNRFGLLEFINMTDFSFLSDIEGISINRITLENLPNTSDPDLVAFIEKNTIRTISLVDQVTLPLHQVYTKKESLKSLGFVNTGLSRIPQSIINRINRFRLSGDNQDEISIGFSDYNLPPCVDCNLNFTNKQSWAEDYNDSMRRFRHYITKHFDTGNFEEVPSCQKFHRALHPD